MSVIYFLFGVAFGVFLAVIGLSLCTASKDADELVKNMYGPDGRLKCPVCDGSGIHHDYYNCTYHDRRCLACDGSGRVPVE